MERRVLAWVVISIGIYILYLKFMLPPLPPPGGGDAARQVAAGDKGDGRVGDDKPLLEGAPPEPIEAAADAPEAPAIRLPNAREVSSELVILGSADPNGPYEMLLTATNTGAAIRRAELSDPRFRDVHDDAGYLGSLEPVDAPGGGAKVQVVGPGTPAAQAGLRAGDVIKGLGASQVQSVKELQAALAETSPRETIELVVERDGQRLPSLRATLIRPPMAVMRPERENLLSREAEVPDPLDDPPSLLLTLEQIGDLRLGDGDRELPQVDLLTGNWEIVPAGADAKEYLFVPQGPDEVVFRKVVAVAHLEVYKRYTIARMADGEGGGAAPAYHFKLEIGIRNLGPEAQQVAYRLDGPTGLPTEGWWYINRIGRGWFESSGLRDVIARFIERPTQQFGASSIAQDEDGLAGGRPIVYAGVDSLYFAAILIPEKKALGDEWFADIEAVALEPELKPSENQSLTNVTCRLTRNSVTLPPGGSHTDAFTVFCGPKRPALLAQYYPPDNADYNLRDLIYYGWFWWVARPMLGLLGFFYNIVGNYGIAVVMLTVLVRACMLPLSLKQAKNMAKMQELQPEMQRLAEKYKSDMEKRARAQQDLFKKHNYNPMGGCLMAFVQLPIFVGLYRGLMLDIELRQAPLFTEAIRWCSNLAAPDMLLDWSGWMPSFIQGFLGPYLNILPIITIVLFLVQQKLFMPPPTTEQAAMQQKIMKFMMIFIGFLFYKVAAALCLYFIASSLWGILERKLIPRAMPQSAGAVAAVQTGDGAKKDRPANSPRTGRNGQPPSNAKVKTRRKK